MYLNVYMGHGQDSVIVRGNIGVHKPTQEGTPADLGHDPGMGDTHLCNLFSKP
jgi:hypothetical protein